jgi:hypothetical protein
MSWLKLMEFYSEILEKEEVKYYELNPHPVQKINR